MNDEPLPPEHGFPVRAVVPGHVGVRNVKWLDTVVVDNCEATGTWQRGMAYKGFGPNIRSLEGFTEGQIASVTSVQELPVNSVITVPEEGEVLEHDGYGVIKGYAFSGGGRGVIRVDVSLDGGESWAQARLLEGSKQPVDRAWAWTLWEYELPEAVLQAKSTPLKIICKATDASYNCQPESVKHIWNIRGIINNAWHNVNATAVQQAEDEEEAPTK